MARKFVSGLVFPALAFVLLVCLSMISCGGKPTWEMAASQKQLTAESICPTAASFIDAKKGMMVYLDMVYVSEDGGTNWVMHKLKTAPCLSGTELVNANTFVIGCSCSNAKISRDSGETWVLLDAKNTTMLSFAENATGWLATPFELYNYDGTSSTKISRPFEKGKISTIAYISGTEGYVLGEQGDLYYTADCGGSWKHVLSMPSVNKELMFVPVGTAMRFTDKAHGVIVAFDKGLKKYRILETADSGASWKQRVSIEAPFGAVSITRNLDTLTIIPYSGANKLMVFRNAPTL